MPLKVSRRKAGGCKAKYNERRNSLQAQITHATPDCGPGDFGVHRLEKHKVQGTNTAWANIAFLPPAQRERFFISGRAMEASPSPLLSLETPCAEVWGHTLQLWLYSENRTGFVTHLPCLSADRKRVHL